MRWASAVSDNASLEQAVNACAEELRRGLEGEQADLAVVFVSPHFSADYERVPELLRQELGPALIFGCSAGGVIGAGREVEHGPGLSLTAACLPDVKLTPFHVEDGALPDPDASPEQWETLVSVTREESPHFIVLSDPFSLRAEEFLVGLDYGFPASPKIGGLASGGDRPRGNVLYLGQQSHREGVVGVALQGNVRIDTVVAQGCRPVGTPMRVTKCDRNLLLEIDGRTPMEVLQQLYASCSDRDRQLFRHSLFLGIVMDELQEHHRLGDFLVRNLLGIDQESGGMAVGAMLREHQTVQFHLRDAQTASDDLRAMLAQYLADCDPAPAEGALLFQCTGRGAYLYGHPDHDTDLFREHLGPLALGGFFCAGEIGPVSGATYLHGYTSSFGIFRPIWPE